jgi:hypothetical protein
MTHERLERILVELGCLACGDDASQLVEALGELGPLPRRCVRCGGNVLALATSTRWVPNPDVRFDFWGDDPVPHAGRPRKKAAVA